MHWLEPAHPQEVRNSVRILPVRLHRRGGKGEMNLPRLHLHSLKAALPQTTQQPFRRWRRLKPDSLELGSVVLKHIGDRLGVCRGDYLLNDLPILIDDTDRRLLKRYVQSGIQAHDGHSPLMAPPQSGRDGAQ